MTYLVFAWIASFLFGVEAITAKLTSKYSIDNPWILNFFWALFTLIFIIPIALYYGAGLPTHWWNLLIASMLSAVAGSFYILALANLDVSVLSPLFSFRTVFAVILGVFVANEALSMQQIILIAVIFIFGFFVSFVERFSLGSFFRKGTFFAIACTITLPFYALFTKRTVSDLDFWTASLWIMLLGQIWLLPTLCFFGKQVRDLTRAQYKNLIIISVVATLGTLASFRAYAGN